MHIAARRLGIDPAELARRNLVRVEQMPYRAAAGRGLRLRRLRTPASSRALELAGYDDLRAEQARARAEGRLLGHRPGLRGRAERLQHGLHHARAERRGARARACPRAATPRASRSRWARTAASRCASRRRRRARATAPWRRRSRPTSSASSPSRSTCAPMPTRPPTPGRCRPATTRAASRRWAPPPCTSRPRGWPIACARWRRRCSAARPDEIELVARPGARARRRGAQRPASGAWPAPRTGTRAISRARPPRDSR